MKTISTDELKTLRDASHGTLVVVNTLPEEQFGEAHIPDSISIPENRDDFIEEVEKAAGGKDPPVVVYCANQQCDSSSKAARKLDEAGFVNVYDYVGGAKAWEESGEPLVSSD